MLTLWLPAEVQKAPEVNELLAGYLIRVDIHSFSLAGQKVGGIDSACAAPIHRIEGVSAPFRVTPQ